MLYDEIVIYFTNTIAKPHLKRLTKYYIAILSDYASAVPTCLPGLVTHGYVDFFEIFWTELEFCSRPPSRDNHRDSWSAVSSSSATKVRVDFRPVVLNLFNSRAKFQISKL